MAGNKKTAPQKQGERFKQIGNETNRPKMQVADILKSEKDQETGYIPEFWIESIDQSSDHGPKRYIEWNHHGNRRGFTACPTIPWPAVSEARRIRKDFTQTLKIDGRVQVKDPWTVKRLLEEYRDNKMFRSVIRFDAQKIVTSGILPYDDVAEMMHMSHPNDIDPLTAEPVPYKKGMSVRYPIWQTDPNPAQRKTVMTFRTLRDTRKGEDIESVVELAKIDPGQIEGFGKEALMLLGQCLGMPGIQASKSELTLRYELELHVGQMSRSDFEAGVFEWQTMREEERKTNEKQSNKGADTD